MRAERFRRIIDEGLVAGSVDHRGREGRYTRIFHLTARLTEVGGRTRKSGRASAQPRSNGGGSWVGASRFHLAVRRWRALVLARFFERFGVDDHQLDLRTVRVGWDGCCGDIWFARRGRAAHRGDDWRDRVGREYLREEYGGAIEAGLYHGEIGAAACNELVATSARDPCRFAAYEAQVGVHCGQRCGIRSGRWRMRRASGEHRTGEQRDGGNDREVIH